uniref:Uncharacterized protein n=1 Tax=Rhizophora mucronata TaxID=61149 RepID=A0A2P2K1X7_RHIMU
MGDCIPPRRVSVHQALGGGSGISLPITVNIVYIDV